MFALRNTIAILTLLVLSTSTKSANIPVASTNKPDVAQDVRIDCNSDEIVVVVSTRSGKFNGMIYPRGLSKNSTCLTEWIQHDAPVRYVLPLRGCNTMSTELDGGGIEYYNTIVVQPHLKLVTNQGRGFHIRCRYQTRDNTVTNNALTLGGHNGYIEAQPLVAPAPLPVGHMKIYYGDPSMKEVAENVKIGDPLTLVVSLDNQDTYGFRVTDCIVRDGLGWGEQRLINAEGCPVDNDIMGTLHYSEDKLKANVHFQAHKFPYTASVYYQCNIKLCMKENGGCDHVTPPACGNRIRRQSNKPDGPLEGTPATIAVYSDFFVNEVNDLSRPDLDDGVYSEKASEDSICISQRSFAIGICIAGLILMLLVVAAILILLARRRSKKVSSQPGSSIYSGPYTNTAYSHSS